VTTKRESAYDKKLAELIAQAGKLTDAQVADVLAMLETARNEIAARVATTEWQAHRLPELKAAMDQAIEAVRLRYSADQAEALTNMWASGIDVIDGPLSTAGIRVMATSVSRTALEIAQGYSADLIRGLAEDLRKQVSSEITLGIMGQKTPYEVMQAIGTDLEGPQMFGKISRRAECITRTEMGRVHGAARQARIDALMATGATDPPIRLMKKWISSDSAHPRTSHHALNGMIVPIDQNFPGNIPYPHAPGLSAAEVINCG